jgi:hypothetical protein
MAAGEVIFDFSESRETPASQTRSTLITTSVQAIRARGRFEEYEKALTREEKETILTTVAGVWVPIDVAFAHYTACEGLGLRAQEQFAIGMEVGKRVQGTMLGLVVRTAKEAGLTPWMGLSQSARLYERLFQGGSVKLVKLGPKEARLEVVNNRLFSLAYFRNGIRGLVCSGAQLFCKKAYVHELPRLTNATAMGLLVSWA